jgi:hypothetical protein
VGDVQGHEETLLIRHKCTKIWVSLTDSENLLWIELLDGRMLCLTEDGRITMENKAGIPIVKKLLARNMLWEEIQ